MGIFVFQNYVFLVFHSKFFVSMCSTELDMLSFESITT